MTDSDFEASLRYARLTGRLMAMCGDLLARIERCEGHDSLLVAEDRRRFDAIERVLHQERDWTDEEMDRALDSQVRVTGLDELHFVTKDYCRPWWKVVGW